MAYDSLNDPYLNIDTGVLLNKLGIDSADKLEVAEAEITTVIIATMKLAKTYRLNNFNKSLFLSIHKEIFGDIYEWAGSVRSIDVSKGSSYFAHAAYIDTALEQLFIELVADQRFHSIDKVVFIKAITYYHSELNAVHPFREGNGRVIRTFLSLLSENIGWHIDWSGINKDDNIRAAQEAMATEPKLLYDMLYSITSKSS